MRMIHEDASSFNTQWKSGKFSHSKKVLTADVAITQNGSIVNVFDPNGGNWNVTMPPLEAGRFYAVAHIGTSGTITIKAATGATISVLDSSGDATLFFASESEWTGMSSSLNLTDFGYTGAGHHSGLVPDPGVGPAQAPPNLRFLSELGWSTVAGLAVSNDYFKGHKGGAVTLTPLGSETLEFLSANTAITILANSGTTPKSIGFTLNAANISHNALSGYVANEHINHAGVTLTAGLGISGGGDITASRTFDFAPSELTVNGAPVTGDYLVMDLAAGGPRRTLVSTLGSIINHNALLNYVAFEHINHANVSMVAGMGLSGGGDITTSRSFAVNFDEFPTDSPSGNDFIPFFDSSDGLHKKTLVSNVGGGGSGGGSGGSKVYMTDTKPLTALNGDLWWETDTGYLFVYYDDGSSAQWVSALPSAAGGSVTEAPTDTLMYGRKDGVWARSVAVAGDTMTGVLTVASGSLVIQSASFPSLYIVDTSGKQFRQFSAFNRYYLQNSTDAISLLEATGATSATSTVAIPGTTPSTSPNTGALTVGGGVGISGEITVAKVATTAGVRAGALNGALAGTGPGMEIYADVTKSYLTSFDRTVGFYAPTDYYSTLHTFKAPGPVVIENTAASSSPSTGALTVAGGIGVGASSAINSPTATSALVLSGQGLAEYVNNGNLLTLQNPVTAYDANPFAGILFQVNYGPGVAGVGGIVVGKENTTSGNLAGKLQLWTRTGAGSELPGLEVLSTQDVKIYGATASSSPTTGALVVAGGVGIGGKVEAASFIAGGSSFKWPIMARVAADLNVGFNYADASTVQFGALNDAGSAWMPIQTASRWKFIDTTVSTSATTGALTVAGGIGCAGNIFLKPPASVTPANNGEMTFQLTSNTSLAIKVKGSDAVVRTVTLTLA